MLSINMQFMYLFIHLLNRFLVHTVHTSTLSNLQFLIMPLAFTQYSGPLPILTVLYPFPLTFVNSTLLFLGQRVPHST